MFSINQAKTGNTKIWFLSLKSSQSRARETLYKTNTNRVAWSSKAYFILQATFYT